jgi:hypothetical protein
MSLIHYPSNVGRNVFEEPIEDGFSANIGERQANLQGTSKSCCTWYKAVAWAFAGKRGANLENSPKLGQCPEIGDVDHRRNCPFWSPS